jgi:hypothetical protein
MSKGSSRGGARLCLAIALATAGGAVPAQAQPVTKGVYTGVISVGRGAAGVTLGMTRAQVIRRLGRPFNENRNGYMEYSRNYSRGLFEVYLTAGKVRMIVADGKPHSGWRLDDGNHVFDRGGWARLRRGYGRRLKLTRLDHVDWAYRITSRLHGRTAWTDFSVWPLNSNGVVEGVTIVFPPSG